MEYNQLFSYFKDAIQEQIAMSGAQVGLLINILSRDGNSIARTSWIESLYNKEWEKLRQSSKELQDEIDLSENSDDFCRGKLLKIYQDCLRVAFFNDEQNNREARITDDERSILNVLADRLNISIDEASAIENLIDPVPQNNALEGLNTLREMGVLFINRKRSEVLIADEVVAILNEIQGKELADKHTLRILRSLSDAEISNVLKHYGKKVRGIDRAVKINEIIHSRVPIRYVLQRDIFSSYETQNQRKDRLKILISDLDLNIERIGTTLEERIDFILYTLNQSANDEFESLSAAGFKEL